MQKVIALTSAQLRVVFVGQDEHMGQKLIIDGINEHTTMEFAAQYVLNHLNELGAEISFAPEYSDTIILNVTKRKVTGEGANKLIESLTGFLFSGLSCCVNSILLNGCAHVHIGSETKFIEIPFFIDDYILKLKQKIFELTKISVINQRLKFGENVLINDKTMRQYQFNDQVDLYLNIEPRVLQINLPKGNPFYLKVENHEKVGDIFVYSCEKAKFNPKDMQIRLNGIKMNRNCLISEIDDNEKLKIAISQKDLTNIKIKMSEVKVVELQVEYDDTISEVKLQIEEQEKIPFDLIKLMKDRKECANNNTLRTYGIKKGDILLFQSSDSMKLCECKIQEGSVIFIQPVVPIPL
ncbi:MAG: hypothetical protein EZS28_046047, partial [Streblomastix strix]